MSVLPESDVVTSTYALFPLLRAPPPPAPANEKGACVSAQTGRDGQFGSTYARRCQSRCCPCRRLSAGSKKEGKRAGWHRRAATGRGTYDVAGMLGAAGLIALDVVVQTGIPSAVRARDASARRLQQRGTKNGREHVVLRTGSCASAQCKSRNISGPASRRSGPGDAPRRCR